MVVGMRPVRISNTLAGGGGGVFWASGMLAQSLAVRLVYNVLSTVLAAGTLDLGAIQMLVERNLQNIMLLHQTGHMFHLRCSHAVPPSIYQFNSSKERLALKCILERYLPFNIFLCKESTHFIPVVVRMPPFWA